MTLTVTQTSSIASVGTSAAQTGSAVSGQKQSDVFGSLLASLFGMVDQITGGTDLAAIVETQPINPQNLQVQDLQIDELLGADGKPLVGIPGLDIATLLGATETEVNADGTPQEPLATPQQLVAALVKVLQSMEGSVNTAQLTDANKAVDAISKLLAGAVGASATSEPTLALTANATPAANTQQNTNAAQIANAMQNANLLPNANLVPNAQAGAQADALAKLAEKFSVQAPELSAKLSQLSDKLQQMAPPPAAATQESELHQTLQSLFGEKQVTGKSSNTPLSNTLPTGAAKGLDQSAAPTTSPIDSVKLDLTATKALNQASAQPAVTTAATATPPASAETTIAVMAAATNSTTPLAKSDPAALTDAQLLTQSNNQLGIKTDIAAAVKPMTAAYQPATQNLNMPHIAFEIARNQQDGVSRFQIRLDPPEMGRIDVKLNVDGAGNLHARMTVDRAETLDLLQRDARALERALQQAGIESGRTNLEFSLRQNPFTRQDGQSGNQPNGEQFSLDDMETETAIADIPAAIYYRGTASPGGINMLA